MAWAAMPPGCSAERDDEVGLRVADQVLRHHRQRVLERGRRPQALGGHFEAGFLDGAQYTVVPQLGVSRLRILDRHEEVIAVLHAVLLDQGLPHQVSGLFEVLADKRRMHRFRVGHRVIDVVVDEEDPGLGHLADAVDERVRNKERAR